MKNAKLLIVTSVVAVLGIQASWGMNVQCPKAGAIQEEHLANGTYVYKGTTTGDRTINFTSSPQGNKQSFDYPLSSKISSVLGASEQRQLECIYKMKGADNVTVSLYARDASAVQICVPAPRGHLRYIAGFDCH